MRLFTAFAAFIAALIDAVFGVVRALFADPDPTAAIDRAECAVRAEIAAIETTDDAPVAVARRFLAGDNRGYSQLPRRAQAWLSCAAELGIVIEDSTDAEVGAWLSGFREHAAIPPAVVQAVMRGEHMPRPDREVDAPGYSPSPAPAF